MDLFNHGKAITKRDIIFMEEQFSWGYFNCGPSPPLMLKIGAVGIITGYLPEMEKFAVSLENGSLVTFSMPEEEFKDLFHVYLNEGGELNGD